MNGRMGHRALAIAIIVGMILGTLVGAFNFAASGAFPAALPLATAAEQAAAPLTMLSDALHSGVGLVAALQSAANYALGPYSYLSSRVTPYEWAAAAQLATGSSAGLTTSDVLTNLISVGGIIAVAAICAATAGIACAIVAVAFVVAIVVSAVICALGLQNLFGDCNPPSGGASALALGQLMLADAGQLGFNVLATSTTNLMNALNGTQTALAYEAASAALTQLGNSSFNVPQDLAQSGVAQQMASEAWGVETGLATIYAKLYANFNFQEGLGNPSNFYCSLTVANAFGGIPDVNPTGADLCPNGPHATNSLYVAYGQIFPSTEVTLSTSSSGYVSLATNAQGCFAEWIQKGSSYWVGTTTPTPSIVLIPDDLKDPWTNVTISYSYPAGHEETNATWNVPSGGYYVCSSSAVAITLGFAFTFGLNVAAQGIAGNAPAVVWENPTTAPSGGNPMSGQAGAYTAALGPMSALETTGGHCALQVDQWGGNVNGSSAMNDLTCLGAFAGERQGEAQLLKWLGVLENNAVNQAIVYWGFLHFTLGYTSESQVPARCIVPSPSSLLPPNVPPSVLAAMNATSLLVWYQAQLRALGQTFDLNDTLTSATICGVHPKWQGGNATAGFGVFATGYVFVNGSGIKSSDGLVSQTFANPTTWNLSGSFYMAPTVANYSAIPLNKTFELGTVNAASFFVDPFYKNGNGTNPTANVVLNRTGPTSCITANKSGCLQLAIDTFVTRPLNGNSTAGSGLTGSIYPTSVTHTFGGAAVFLTACFVAQVGATQANASYHTVGTCSFSINSLNSTGTSCQGGITYSQGVPIGTCSSGGGSVIVVTGCSSNVVLFGPFLAYISSLFGNGAIGCIVAWVLVVVLIVVLLFGVVEVVAFGVRQARKGSGGGPPRGG